MTVALRLLQPGQDPHDGWSTVTTLTVPDSGTPWITGDPTRLPFHLPALAPGRRLVHYTDDPAGWAIHLHSRLRTPYLVPKADTHPGWDTPEAAHTTAATHPHTPRLTALVETAAGMGGPGAVPVHVQQAACLLALTDTSSGHPGLEVARRLVGEGVPRTVVDLVAWHTDGPALADQLGLRGRLRAYPRPVIEDLDLLTLIDLCVDSAGRLTTPPDRIAELLTTGGPGHPGYEALTRCRAELLTAAARAGDRLGLPRDWS